MRTKNEPWAYVSKTSSRGCAVFCSEDSAKFPECGVQFQVPFEEKSPRNAPRRFESLSPSSPEEKKRNKSENYNDGIRHSTVCFEDPRQKPCHYTIQLKAKQKKIWLFSSSSP